MEPIIDAIKKRAWRSVWLSLRAFVAGLVVGLLATVKSWLKSLALLFMLGWAFGFGGYFGLSVALNLDASIGGNRAVFVELMPVQVVEHGIDGQE